MTRSIDGTCHGCVHHRQTPFSFAAPTHTCVQTGNALPVWTLETPATCPYHAMPSGDIVRRLDALDATLDAFDAGGLPPDRWSLAELQAEVAAMAERADAGLLPRLHALQHRLGTIGQQPPRDAGQEG